MKTVIVKLVYFIIIWIGCNKIAADTIGSNVHNDSSDKHHYENVLIDSIVLDNRNIYDIENKTYDNFIFKLANKLHFKTNETVIKRELLFEKGDHYSVNLIEETLRNLRRRLVLFDAWIEEKILPNGHLLLRVVTIDQWSLSSGININRDGNETRYKIGLREKNFMGNNQLFSFYYINNSRDDYIETDFSDIRFFGAPYRIDLKYINNPVSSIKRIRFGRPFYTLKQKFSYDINISKTYGRRDIYNDSIVIAESFNDGDLTEIRLSHRFGTYYKKFETNLTYKYRYEKNSGTFIYTNTPEDSALAISSFPDDSVYHRLGIINNYSQFQYIKLRQIDGFSFTEDFITGYFITLDFERAFEPSFNNYEFDIIKFKFSRNISFRSNLIFLDYGHSFWYRESSKKKHSSFFSVKFYNHSFSYLTLAIRGAYLSDWYQVNSNNLILGGSSGIRGYNTYFRTGNRKAILNIESRFFPGIKFMSLIWGGVLFADIGNIWKADEPITIRNYNNSIGAGLRIAFDKSSKNIIRFDFAYSKQNNWEFSIGTKQYFRASNF